MTGCALWIQLFTVVLLVCLFPRLSTAKDIDSCKYLAVTDFTSDPYGIAQELRRQAGAKGFTVISNPRELDEMDILKTCVMAGSWNSSGIGGSVAVRVTDSGGNLLGDAVASGTAWWSVQRTVRETVKKLYAQLGYSGFSEVAFQEHLHSAYPPRPQLATNEAQIRATQPRSSVEGIWTDPGNKYRLGVVKAPDGGTADYVAVILQSVSPVWKPGEIKAEIRTTASAGVFTCTYFMANKKPFGTTLLLDHDAELKGSITTPSGPFDLVLLRVWPEIRNQPVPATSQEGQKTGTGFPITQSGLIATNWHVVSDSKRITVTLPGWKEGVEADILVRDVSNDLAILRLANSSRLSEACHEWPFQLAPTKDISLGQHVSTVGYPLSPLLGSTPKFSEGAIAGKSGLQDDPRWFQISAAVQPGSSGSPLFDADGNIVGIVVASLDPAKAYQLTSAIPQNVNWAIKSDYLLNLAGMIPNEKLASRTVPFTPDKAAVCVALITAW